MNWCLLFGLIGEMFLLVYLHWNRKSLEDELYHVRSQLDSVTGTLKEIAGEDRPNRSRKELVLLAQYELGIMRNNKL